MKSVFAAITALCVQFVLAVPAARERPRNIDPETLAKRAQMRLERTGGLIIKPDSGKGSVVWIDAQKRVPRGMRAPVVEEQSNQFIMNIVLKDGVLSFSAPDVQKTKDALGVEAVLFIVDDATLPSILLAPENHWAVLNIAVLLQGAPSPDVLEKRMRREMWRVFGQLLGSADCSYRNCVLVPVTSMEQIDSMKANMFCPDPYGRVRSHLKAIGVQPYLRTSYRHACQEGWAPAPTNGYQQAIWEKVKADKERGPTNPIPIPPPNAKK